MIPFRIKKLTDTAKAPAQKDSILWDLYVDDFCVKSLKDAFYNDEFNFLFKKKVTFIDKVKSDKIVEIGSNEDDLFDGKGVYLTQSKSLANFIYKNDELILHPQGRILIKTGISLELPIQYSLSISRAKTLTKQWLYKKPNTPNIGFSNLEAYAVAEIKSRSDNLEQKGLFIENKIITGGEISFVVINHGHEAITIEKGEPIAKMLIKPVYPSKMEEVKEKVRKEKFLEEEEPTEIKLNLPKVKLPHF